MSKEACEVLQVAKSATYESCITFVYVLRCEERTLTYSQAFAWLFADCMFLNLLGYLKRLGYIEHVSVERLTK